MVLERILLSWSFDIADMSFWTPSKDSRLSASTSRMSAEPLHHIEIRDSGYFRLRSLYGQSCWKRRKTSNISYLRDSASIGEYKSSTSVRRSRTVVVRRLPEYRRTTAEN